VTVCSAEDVISGHFIISTLRLLNTSYTPAVYIVCVRPHKCLTSTDYRGTIFDLIGIKTQILWQ
jgi:hypothetical protein